MLKIIKTTMATAAALATMIGGIQDVTALSLTTTAQTFDCTQTGSISATCSTDRNLLGGSSASELSLARAEFGSLGVLGSVSQVNVNGFGISSGSISTIFPRATAQFEDTLTFNVQQGFLRVGFNISGENKLEATGTFRGSSNLASKAEISFFLGSFTNSSTVYRDLLFSGSQAGEGLNIEQTTTGSLGFNTVDIAFDNGRLNLRGSLRATVACANQFDGGTCSASSNFFNSATLAAALVLDTNSVEIQGATISSNSGFDYSTGFVSAVPVPAALPLFGTGLALMGFIGWRRKRNLA